eukprot:3474879-Rhodomonas_salina.2
MISLSHSRAYPGTQVYRRKGTERLESPSPTIVSTLSGLRFAVRFASDTRAPAVANSSTTTSSTSSTSTTARVRSSSILLLVLLSVAFPPRRVVAVENVKQALGIPTDCETWTQAKHRHRGTARVTFATELLTVTGVRHVPCGSTRNS